MILQDISSLSVLPDAPRRDVLRVLDAQALGFVLVLDAEQRLLGTITDGDIRRALLREDQAETARDFMNPAPRVLHTPRDYSAFLARNRLTFVPIVDADQRVLSVALAANNPGRQIDHVCVVVMAGGLGSRLGDLTKDTPKPLLDVGGEPVLQRIVRHFRDEGFRHFIFCVNYKAEMIRAHFGDGSDLSVQIDYVTETRRMGTGGALSLIERKDFSRFVVTNADILCSDSYREMLEFHEEQGAAATMAVREHVVEIPFGVVETNGFEIRSLREKPSFTHFINAGYYVIEAAALDHVSPDTFFDMPTLFDILRQQHERTRIYPTRGSWIDIGRPEDLEQARQSIQQEP